MLIVLVTTPLWIKQIGLYQYLALEIMIWMLFALSYNLLLGQAGLPSFGHGAFFGVGAYAFGLPSSTSRRTCGSVWPRRWSRRRWPAGWWPPSSRTVAASTTRC